VTTATATATATAARRGAPVSLDRLAEEDTRRQVQLARRRRQGWHRAAGRRLHAMNWAGR
jgi:hypothetical protein